MWQQEEEEGVEKMACFGLFGKGGLEQRPAGFLISFCQV